LFHLTRQERLVLIFVVAALAVGAAVKAARGERAPAAPRPTEVEFDLAVPKPSVDAAALAAATAPEKINVNTADAEALCKLPGVGVCYAARIVAYREEHGPFERPEDLAAVRGIGPKTVEKLKPYVTCEPQP
jgi:competence ComEA-like helix-hairpin-helix protein